MNQSDCQNIQFNGSDFTSFINFVKSMNSKDKSKYSRLVLLHVENDKLVCRAIDDNSNYIEYYVELFHTENEITEYISVAITDILALVKCSSNSKFTIRKCFNQYEFNVIGDGWLPFNVIDVDITKYDIKGTTSVLGEVNANKLHDAISSVLSYTQEYTYDKDKYITFKADKMFATSRLSGVMTKGNFVEMVLRSDDAARLKLLLKDCDELRINSIKSEIEQLCFESKRFKFIINRSDIDTNDNSYNKEIDNYITVNCDELYKLVLFAEEYSASKHLVGLTIKNGKLIASVKNTLGANHVSVIESKPVGNISNTHEVVAKAKNIIRSLKIFQYKHIREINIYISDELLADQNSIIIFDDNTQAIINIIQ